MQENTEVITLQPGSGPSPHPLSGDFTARPDWSPQAQPPGPDDVIAHTPNPAAYHDVGGRVMIPRAKPGKNAGGSRAFSTQPGKVNIDPADPVRGTGGMTVDLSSLSATAAKKASELGQGDPLKSWYAAAQLQQGSAVKQATAPAPPAPAPAALPTVTNPSVVPSQEAVAANVPQFIPEAAPNPPAASVPPSPAVSVPQSSVPPPSSTPAMPDTVSQQMLQVLQALAAEVRALREPPQPQAVPEPPKPEPEPAVEEPSPGLAVPEDVGLPFLTEVPSPPKVQVIFDLGKGGRHLKRFHHVAIRGSCLSVLFDTRYEGDQFIPPATEDGDPPITITFPQYRNRKLRAYVPEDFNQRLGCLDQLNFIIVEDDVDSDDVRGLSDELRRGVDR